MNIFTRIAVWTFSVGILLSTVFAQATTDIDFDDNDVIDFGDFILLAQAFGTGDTRFDLNGDDAVDFQDFLIFARLYDKAQHTVTHTHVEQDVVVGSVDIYAVPTLGSQPGDIASGCPGPHLVRADGRQPDRPVRSVNRDICRISVTDPRRATHAARCRRTRDCLVHGCRCKRDRPPRSDFPGDPDVYRTHAGKPTQRSRFRPKGGSLVHAGIRQPDWPFRSGSQ